MDEEVDVENVDQDYSVQVKSEPTVFEMSVVNMNKGTEPRELYPKKNPSDESVDYKCETAQNVQNVDFQIKRELNLHDSFGLYSWNMTDSIEHPSDYSNNSLGTTDLHVHNRPSFILRNKADYAVCIKYEPNVHEESNSSSKGNQSKPCLQTEKNQDTSGNAHNKDNYRKSCLKTEQYQDTPKQNSQHFDHCDDSCFGECGGISFNLQNQDELNRDVHPQFKSIKYEIPELNTHAKTNECCEPNVENNSVHNYHNHDHTYCICSEESCRLQNTRILAEAGTAKMHQSDMCSYISYDHGQLEAHEEKHNGTKPYKCDLCSYSSISLSYLKAHKQKHKGEKLYKCDICDYNTVLFSNLVEHIRKHKGKNPYKCNICTFSTTLYSHLAEHKRKHSVEEKTYKSHVLSTTCDVRAHNISHTGEKRYTCDVCNYSTYRDDLLARHIKRQHTGGKQHYKCEECSFYHCVVQFFSGTQTKTQR